MTDPSAGRAAAWTRVAPFALFIALLVAEPFASALVEPRFDPRWLYAIRSAATALLLLALSRSYVELRGARGTGLASVSAAVGVGVAVFAVWIALDFPPLVLGAADHPFTPLVDGRIDTGLALSRLAGAALVVPVMEELFWRSFLLRWLEKPRFTDVDPRDIGWKSLIITSAVFAAEHRLWLAGLLAGLAYGELYRRTADLRLAVLAHAVTNGLLGAYVLATGSWSFW